MAGETTVNEPYLAASATQACERHSGQPSMFFQASEHKLLTWHSQLQETHKSMMHAMQRRLIHISTNGLGEEKPKVDEECVVRFVAQLVEQREVLFMLKMSLYAPWSWKRLLVDRARWRLSSYHRLVGSAQRLSQPMQPITKMLCNAVVLSSTITKSQRKIGRSSLLAVGCHKLLVVIHRYAQFALKQLSIIAKTNAPPDQCDSWIFVDTFTDFHHTNIPQPFCIPHPWPGTENRVPAGVVHSRVLSQAEKAALLSSGKLAVFTSQQRIKILDTLLYFFSKSSQVSCGL